MNVNKQFEWNINLGLHLLILVVGLLVGCSTLCEHDDTNWRIVNSEMTTAKEYLEHRGKTNATDVVLAVKMYVGAKYQIYRYADEKLRDRRIKACSECENHFKETLSFLTFFGQKCSTLVNCANDLSITNRTGMTALHFAIYSPELVRLLLAKGAPINSQNNMGETALHCAMGSLDFGTPDEFLILSAQLLVNAGADTNIRDCYGKIPLDCLPANYKGVCLLVNQVCGRGTNGLFRSSKEP
ncbi:MAG: ankyrin repeat domain-containing protein [bacterium]